MDTSPERAWNFGNNKQIAKDEYISPWGNSQVQRDCTAQAPNFVSDTQRSPKEEDTGNWSGSGSYSNEYLGKKYFRKRKHQVWWLSNEGEWGLL